MSKFVTVGKSKQLFEYLKNELTSDDYKEGDKFPSIRELSLKYGVSSITVNSVISNLVTEGLLYVEQGKGTYVSAKKQKPESRKKMIGVMLFDFSQESSVEASMFDSIQKTLTESYYVILYNSYNKVELFYKGLKGLSELNVDGLILLPPSTEDYAPEIVRELIGNIPVVFINRAVPGIRADLLAMDFELAAYTAAHFLLEKGRRNIMVLGYDSRVITAQLSLGMSRAHAEAGIALDEHFLIAWQDDFSQMESDVKRALGEIDGLIGSDMFIHKLRKTIVDSGKTIPEDMSIVGINNTVYSQFMVPPLTSIPFPSRQIGTEAAKSLMERIEDRRSETIQRAFCGELIIRGSC